MAELIIIFEISRPTQATFKHHPCDVYHWLRTTPLTNRFGPLRSILSVQDNINTNSRPDFKATLLCRHYAAGSFSHLIQLYEYIYKSVLVFKRLVNMG
jgi:hypothetical protein